MQKKHIYIFLFFIVFIAIILYITNNQTFSTSQTAYENCLSNDYGTWNEGVCVCTDGTTLSDNGVCEIDNGDVNTQGLISGVSNVVSGIFINSGDLSTIANVRCDSFRVDALLLGGCYVTKEKFPNPPSVSGKKFKGWYRDITCLTSKIKNDLLVIPPVIDRFGGLPYPAFPYVSTGIAYACYENDVESVSGCYYSTAYDTCVWLNSQEDGYIYLGSNVEMFQCATVQVIKEEGCYTVTDNGDVQHIDVNEVPYFYVSPNDGLDVHIEKGCRQEEKCYYNTDNGEFEWGSVSSYENNSKYIETSMVTSGVCAGAKAITKSACYRMSIKIGNKTVSNYKFLSDSDLPFFYVNNITNGINATYTEVDNSKCSAAVNECDQIKNNPQVSINNNKAYLSQAGLTEECCNSLYGFSYDSTGSSGQKCYSEIKVNENNNWYYYNAPNSKFCVGSYSNSFLPSGVSSGVCYKLISSSSSSSSNSSSKSNSKTRSSSNIDSGVEPVQTGDYSKTIYILWIVGLVSLGYSFWYFKNIKKK